VPVKRTSLLFLCSIKAAPFPPPDRVRTRRRAQRRSRACARVAIHARCAAGALHRSRFLDRGVGLNRGQALYGREHGGIVRPLSGWFTSFTGVESSWTL
jgi:hypothetical protein